MSLLAVPALAFGSRPSFSTDPGLSPEFAPKTHDYVLACSGDPVSVYAHAPGQWKLAVEGARARGGNSDATVEVTDGESFEVKATRPHEVRHYHVRCLPPDFPLYTFERTGPAQPRFFIVSPSFGNAGPGHSTQFVAVFDYHGAPVWWYRSSIQPSDAKLLSDGSIAWGDVFHYERHALDGDVLSSNLTAVGLTTDLHDFALLPNGNYLMIAAAPRDHVDLSPYGGPADASVVGAEIQEVTPDGELVWSWDSSDHIGLEETGDWWPKVLSQGEPYDIVHVNSVEPIGNSVIVSFRHLSAVYRINRSSGQVDWKLGGTSTPDSLEVVGDPQGDVPFRGQHDARMPADHELTVHDNNTGLGIAPRLARFRIRPTAGTATFEEAISDPDIPASNCCGSARRLPSGDWLASWGGQPLVAGYEPDGTRTFKLDLGGLFSYRAFPVPAGALTAHDLRAGMDAMFPRP